MQFGGRRKKNSINPQSELYGQHLQFYGQPPLENISLSEFETFAVERLKLLKTVENLGVSHVKLTDLYISKLEKELKLVYSYRKNDFYGPTEYEKRRKDHISHFILRLAYCQTEDLRRWFIQQEVDLFRFRFNDLDPKQQLEFLHKNNLRYDTISSEEKTHGWPLHCEHIHDLIVFFSSSNCHCILKVPFQDALDLVRLRKVYLKQGYAYIPHQDIVTIVLNDFRTRLSKALALTARSLPAVHSDERLQPLLNHLSHAYVGQDYSIQKNVGKISLDQIDSLSGKSFPLCMRQLHQSLRENHHLRHGGRMQYGLFLKGIGLSLEQALQFWKMEFIRGKVDADKFDKAYAYSIRHMFGKEGKRTDYTPYSCMKVILSNPPSQGDHHGCPFRHSDPELLKQKLQVYKVSPSGINQILELVKGMHYQLACQKYFELTHNIEDSSFSLNHPNQYFLESQKLLGGGKDIKREMDAPQRSQENAASKGSTATQEVAANTSQHLAEMTEDLDSFFQDA
uniref:DNA primase large subunit n=1 Tax=Oreochromis niloticus TaxID=8128 RepID=A0A669BJM1_ORENI